VTVAAVFAANQATNNDLASWWPLRLLLGGYILVVIALNVFGRSGDHPHPVGRFLLRIPDALHRATGLPGWVAASVGTSCFALLVAGIGFYNDVAWHIYRGRDKALFTAPHTMIVVGLFLIAASGFMAVTFATLERADVGFRLGRIRVPWASVPLILLGVTALGGFPLDDLWHAQFGIDVTMWSPTHLLMILGAAFSPIPGWLLLTEAGVRPTDNRWARFIHTLAAVLVLAGLTAPLGEFAFGVPQFQQLFHPVLIALAAGFALVAARIVLGRGWALGVAVINFVISIGGGFSRLPHGYAHNRSPAIFLGSAIAIEVIAVALGTTRRTRFALASGLAVGTVGFATEWAWNTGAHQPWKSPLLLSAFTVGLLMAIGAALLGAAYSGGVTRSGLRIPKPLLALAGLAVIAAILIPLPRTASKVHGDLTVNRTGDEARVQLKLTPANAADHARWFQVSAWQGGGLVTSELHKISADTWTSDQAVPVGGHWKVVVHIQRGTDMIAIPVFLPKDAEIGKAEIPAVNRSMDLVNEKAYLMRESKGGSSAFAIGIESLLGIMFVAWIATFCMATVKLAAAGPDGGDPADGSADGSRDVEPSLAFEPVADDLAEDVKQGAYGGTR
jgi:hypothetical protein